MPSSPGQELFLNDVDGLIDRLFSFCQSPYRHRHMLQQGKFPGLACTAEPVGDVSSSTRLPLELIELCMDLNVQPATYRLAADRYTTLCTLCLVSKHLTPRYQRQLLDTVVLPSAPQVQSFLRSSVLQQDDDPRRSWTRILKLGALDFTVTPRTFGPPRGYELELGRLLERLNNLQELYISRVSAVSLHQLSSSSSRCTHEPL